MPKAPTDPMPKAQHPNLPPAQRPDSVQAQKAPARRAPKAPLNARVVAVVVAAVLLVVGVSSGFVYNSYERNAPRASTAATTSAPPADPGEAGPEPSPGTSEPESQPAPEQPDPQAEPGPEESAAAVNIDDPASLTVVVNKQRPLPAEFAPAGLVTPRGLANPSSERLRPEAAEALDRMARDAQSEGIRLSLTSGYRSYAEQQTVYGNQVASKGRQQADRVSARPGHSEHQTALAVDLARTDGRCSLLPCFGETPEGRWLAENSWRYGFLLRYPADLTPVVGYAYEPWHFRYVGPELTEQMRAVQVRSLEEFFHLPQAPDYA